MGPHFAIQLLMVRRNGVDSLLSSAEAELARARQQEVEENPSVEGRSLKPVLVLFNHSEGESFEAGVVQVEDGGESHGGQEGGGARPRKHAEGEEHGTSQLGGNGAVGPQQGLGQKVQVLGHDESGKSLGIHKLIQTVVEHHHRGSQAEGEDAELAEEVEIVFPLRGPRRHRAPPGRAGASGGPAPAERRQALDGASLRQAPRQHRHDACCCCFVRCGVG
mmetsp:Transcript_10932/g.28090  ORF Transcript_10932/g.28090 Transcript_10932/m.28090 type:complete len:220 (+) Transcript_10932:754-1413(+)